MLTERIIGALTFRRGVDRDGCLLRRFYRSSHLAFQSAGVLNT